MEKFKGKIPSFSHLKDTAPKIIKLFPNEDRINREQTEPFRDKHELTFSSPSRCLFVYMANTQGEIGKKGPANNKFGTVSTLQREV